MGYGAKPHRIFLTCSIYVNQIMQDVTIIQRTYDLIQWYVPILSRLPRAHKFTLGDRVTNGLYDLLENLIQAKYSHKKLPLLYDTNMKLEILRHQSRLLLDFQLVQAERYEHAIRRLHVIGIELGSWIKQQQKKNRR